MPPLVALWLAYALNGLSTLWTFAHLSRPARRPKVASNGEAFRADLRFLFSGPGQMFFPPLTMGFLVVSDALP